MLTPYSPSSSYQVGGSLPFNAPTYVRRNADEVLFQSLLRGEFCYVFNARQMGKSSLRVQTTHRLQAEGIRCGVIDITAIGTYEISPEQWYASIAGFLVKQFQLQVNLPHWWRDRDHLSYVSRLGELVDTVLLVQIPDPIVLFIDEIDSVLSLNFSTNDFFALIRACYNRRAEHPKYRRLTVSLFGVATPADLITDSTRTPFNIGRAIELRGFQLHEATPLLAGLTETVAHPEAVLQRILHWTNGQPFLTQKLCQLAVQEWRTQNRDGNERETTEEDPIIQSPIHIVDRLVYTRIIHHWETSDEPEHLKTIRDRLLYNEQRSGRLLELYRQIIDQYSLHPTQQDSIATPDIHAETYSDWYGDDNPEHIELLLSGLVEKYQGRLQVKNLIYVKVFNLNWVKRQLINLRPYAHALNAWTESEQQDESCLLRGNALRRALVWSQGKSLSALDYRFLAASQEIDRQEVQRALEAERLKEVEARLTLEHQRGIEQWRSLKRQRLLLGIVTAVMVVAIGLGLQTHHQYRRTAQSELRAIVLSSEALFASHKTFDALLQAIKAKERLNNLDGVDPTLQAQVDAALWRVVLKLQEANRLNGHTAAVLTVDFSPDGEHIATAGVDKTIKLWNPDGTLIKTLHGHESIVRSVKFSPDGTLIASTGDDRTIRLWTRDGTLLNTLQTQTSGVWNVAFSPNSTMLISSGVDGFAELWSREGERLQTFDGKESGLRSVAFSADGETIAAGYANGTIKLWNLDGTLRLTLTGQTAPVQAIAFSPNGKEFVSGSVDGTMKLWRVDGTPLTTIQAHDTAVWSLSYSPTGDRVATGSWDKTIKLWNRDGTLLTTLQGHDAAVWGVAFSPDGETIASAGAENVAILWKSESAFQRTIHGLTGITPRLVFNTDGTTIATAGSDETIKLWNLDGTLLRTIDAHTASTANVDFSPDGKFLASVSEDKTMKLWQIDGTLLRVYDHPVNLLTVDWNPVEDKIAVSGNDGVVRVWKRDGTLLRTLQGHTAPVWDVRYSPNGKILASASNDATIRLWNPDGTLLKILKGHATAVWKVAFSPDGKRLASGSGDKTVKLWSLDGTLIKTLTGHTAAVWGVAFSPDGSLLATASIDETIKLWTQDGTLLTTLEGHQAGTRSVAFHPTLPLLASAGDDQTIMLWNMDEILTLDPLTYACNWVRDYLHTNPQVDESNLQLCQAIP